VDKRVYRILDKIRSSEWEKASDDTVYRFIIALYSAERMAMFLGSSFDCSNLRRAMEKELRIRRRTMGVELKEAS
jgi:hypothetical protein